MSIERHRSCPNCHRRVPLRRMCTAAVLDVSWECPECGAALEFDPVRRLWVAMGSSLLGICPLALGLMAQRWWLAGLGVALFVWIWSFDSVRLRPDATPSRMARG